ncbi:non-ribosomal peptide synthetase [Cellvibrio japonicus]|uniref:Amino acid adenylation domain protein n=1 Tax=Cellvibrio japonicus (strain Ueda107) TaxID=498211 RepID=B3PGL9_CELJU|nr:non-ribosomal peptide synthetase [Cellvibrio japonicus]ACE85121.1 amino acid adenylation domain protein [Cellvibrio japonicus Ueda107]QEI12368.1 non-ribosomal peptide synthetase [Cellvibrio japonicus]QEI15941.1 non-ribosomal peptide synthetase [Cellvibrio japonicus]QEI19520.1 non-ribosomal peptide synthetase [Cellvibrio japonicus]
METENTTAVRIANRFIQLPVEQRRQILEKMREAGQRFEWLPIVQSRSAVEQIPLSYAQQRLLFLWQLDPDNTSYNVPVAVRLLGELNESALRLTFDLLIQRHAVLRTRFSSIEGEFYQIIDDSYSVVLELVDIANEQGRTPESLIEEQVNNEVNRPFDLINGPLIRVKLFRLATAEHILVVCMHHIISDGWSGQLLMEEFSQCYSALVSNIKPSLPNLPIQYADYAIWQRSWLEAGEGERQLRYWKTQLGDEHTLLSLPVDYERPINPGFGGATIRVDIPRELSAALKELARNNGCTLFMVMTMALAVTLSRYSGQTDICIGAPNAGRNREELERLVGFFINTQVLRVQVDELCTFSELLQQVKRTVSGAQSHQEIPFEQLVDALVPERNLSYNPLFQVKINQNVTREMLGNNKEYSPITGLTVQEFPLHERSSHFDLAFDFTDVAQGIDASFTYATDLFKPTTIERLVTSLREVLHRLTFHFHRRIADYPEILSEPVPREIVRNECMDYLALWQHGLQQGSGKPALCSDKQVLDYADLERQTNQLAQHLQASGVVPGTIVALCQERAIEWAISMLAVLKVGGTYMPLDNRQPVDRLQYFLRDSGAAFLIHHPDDHQAKLLDVCTAIPYVADEWCHYSGVFTSPAIDPQQVAYIIYTSGSTGQPKGVAISHQSLANYVQVLQARLQLAPDANMAMVSTIAADLGHTMLFTALASGRLLHLLPYDCAFDADSFACYMATHQVGILKIVPSHLQGLLQASQPEQVLPQHALIVGGEICQWSLVNKVRQLRPGCRIINHYGPTETTVGVSTYEITKQEQDFNNVPIGQPLANSTIQIFDHYLNPVPVQVPGELYIGGQGVAHGYIGQAALTATYFVPDPGANGGRLYRTGDRARHVKEQLIFLGRADDQVKIRGYRVELSEIANTLQKLAEVQEAVVQAKSVSGDSHLQLVAYCVTKKAITSDEIQRQLQTLLPDHMLPSHIVLLDSLPLTANGKLDRKALPQPEDIPKDKTFDAPQGEVEKILAEVWGDVLGVEPIGRHDNFFALGGDSILSLKVIARARKRGIHVTPQQLFEHQVLAVIAEVVISESQGEKDVIPIHALSDVDRQRPLPLSYAQARLWFLWQLDTESTAYHITQALTLYGPLNVEALHNSFAVLVARHESLRTVFHLGNDGQAEQHIQPVGSLTLDIPLLDVTDKPLAERDSYIQREARHLRTTPFDLTRGPLLRIGLIRSNAEQHVLVVVMHHIISDGWSMQVLIDEFVAQYRSQAQGTSLKLPALPIQYVDYAIWQRQRLRDSGQEAQQLAYWKNQLGMEHPVLQLPTDFPRRADGKYLGASYRFEFPPSLVEGLRHRVRTENATVFMVLLAGFQLLLSRYSGQKDIRVGVPIANRHWAETEGLVGFFVNTQVLRTEVDCYASLQQILQQVKTAALAAQHHQDLPFEKLVEVLKPERHMGQNPLFQVMFDHQRTDHQIQHELPGLRLESYSLGEQHAQFELTLHTAEDSHGGIQAIMVYAKELFEHATIERMAEHYLKLLQMLAEQPEKMVGEVDIVSEVERLQLLEWSAPHTGYTGGELIHGLFEQQAAQQFDAVALTCGSEELTYGDLNLRANRLAHYLIASGVKPESRVGIALDRSLEMIVGLLAILKSGGAYVPLDPEYPPERLSYMVEDSDIELLLTNSAIAPRFAAINKQRIVELDQINLDTQSMVNPIVNLSDSNLAYVIYTSGSTGRPKGVQICHHNVSRLFKATKEWFDFSASDVWTFFHSYAFDFSVWELFGSLCSGGRLVLVPFWISRSPEEFMHLLREQQVTVLNQTPSAFNQLVQMPAMYEHPLSLRIVILGGEALEPESLRPWMEQLGDTQPQIINMYGITETTVHVTYRLITRKDLTERCSPIGIPMPDLGLYVLDNTLNLAPIGVAGELYVTGDGLARGYLNRANTTAERFVANPDARVDSRLYRTGDLARWNGKGQLEYLGRIDHQVKIRGFRIELGEIESHLQSQAGVKNAAVVVQDVPGSNSQQLVAYVVPTDAGLVAEDVNTEAIVTYRAILKNHLQAILPEYMVPYHYVLLASMPLTSNGKLNRKALPALDASEFRHKYEAPQSEMEQHLARIWQDVLGVEQVGRHDNFFELGGDSIVSIQLVSRSRQQGIQFTAKDIFQYQTLAELSMVAQAGDKTVHLDQGPVAGILPLTPIQRSFFTDIIPERHHWNQSVLLTPIKPLHANYLQASLEYLLLHHDALRLGFVEIEPSGWQAMFMTPEQVRRDVLWQVVVADKDELEMLCNKAQRSLCLTEGPLMRAVLAELPDGEQRLLLVIHHLVVDGVSWRVLLEDLQTAYRQQYGGKPVYLPLKTSSLQAWSERLYDYAHSDVLQDEVVYWHTALTNVSGDLPRDILSGGLQRKYECHVVTHLDSRWTERLLKEAPRAYRTQINDLLLTALARVIARWTQQPSVLVQLEGHGREDLFEGIDLTRTVGWFTTMYPVKLSPSVSLDTSIKTIKEQLRAVPNKGLGFGVLHYLGDELIQHQLRELPVPRITFNYLGQFDNSFDTEKGLFTPSGEFSGDGHSEESPLGNWLSINGQVYNGELNLGWNFSGEMYRVETIQKLADAYGEELRSLIDHCCSNDQGAVTPSDFPLIALTQEQLDRLPVAVSDIEDIYPLSPMQQGMLFHTVQDNDAGVYINQTIVLITGLDGDRFVTAWEQVIQRQEILRTGFLTASNLNEPLQVVYKKARLPVMRIDWSDRHVTEIELQNLAIADRDNSFNLLSPPLMRLTLVKLDGDRYYLIWTRHHILMDGWSGSLLVAEVLANYFGRSLPARESRYRNYIQWLQAQSSEELQRFWVETVAPLTEPTLLANTLYPKPTDAVGKHEAIYLHWDEDKTHDLIQWSQRHRITPNTLIQGVWLLLLQRFTGQKTVCFGSTVAGRPTGLHGANTVLGLFINTLPVIQTLREEQTVLDWLQQLQNFNLAIRDFEHAPLADIQRWAGRPGQALFDSIIVFENYPIDESLKDAGNGQLEFEAVSSRDVTNYAMDLAIRLGDTLEIEFMYMSHHFGREAVEMIQQSFDTLLKDMLNNPNARLGNLRTTIKHIPDFVAQAELPSKLIPIADKLIVELIQEQAMTRAEAVAVICGDVQLTYGELEQQANRLAQHLITIGADCETCIGVALPRSVEMIVAFYAVLKTGAAYVPLDIDYPQERLQWSIEDSGMKTLITTASVLEQLPALTVDTAVMIDLVVLNSESDNCLSTSIMAENLAYIIYTSGSTGKPKGVSVTHGALAMHCTAIAELYEMDANTRELLFMSFAFDGAQERSLTTLIKGGCLIVRDNHLWTPEETWQALHYHHITIACFPPAYLQQLAEFAKGQDGAPPAVDIYCFGGDAVADANFELVKRHLKPRYLTNGYGPTETVVTPLLWKTDSNGVCEAPYAPIGRQVGKRSIVVLDQQLNPVPVGVIGELYIGGVGLARGYHRQPSLTAERFIANPFSSCGERLYRTGDLVRYRRDGIVDYIGRVDHQVKIRGFRIELGEIESRLRQQPSVQDAVVIARDSEQGKQLVAYVVSAIPDMGDTLRRQLASSLPNYMVPAMIQVMPAFPVGPSGKVDRNALPDIHFKSHTFVAPRNEVERTLAGIWEDVLGVQQIGVTDNFFALGGDSLRALKVLSKIRSQSDIDLKVKLTDMMSKPTIAELSGYSPLISLPVNLLTPLNKRETGLPILFCPHAGYGTVFDYEPLAQQLEGHYAVYGIRCRMLLDTSWNDTSLQAMAFNYINDIRRVQPKGPYYLLGWSLGGTLATLIANQLEREGESIAFLGLVDSFVPRPDVTVIDNEQLEELRGFLTHVYAIPGQHLLPENMDSLVVGDQIATEQFLIQVQNRLGRNTLYGEVDASELAHIFTVGMKLKLLSRQLQEIPMAAAQTYFWWAGKKPKHKVNELESTFIGRMASTNIEATHYDILRHDCFLQSVIRYLIG